MENISILRSDTSERSVAFKFMNTTSTDKEVYVKDITLYSFLRNIDWVNNVFSWIELREIPLKELVCNPPENTDNNTQPPTDQTINVNDSEQIPTEQPSTGDTDMVIKIPILCCLRIPPGSYKNTENIIAVINANLNKIHDLYEYDLAITGIQAIHNVPACAYDIGDIAILENNNNTTPWYPAIINSYVVLNNFDISLDNNNNNPPEHLSCVPVLEYNTNNKELSIPLEGSLEYNNLSLYNSDLISKMGGSSLTSHAISFVNSITSTLTIDRIDVKINDLYTSEYGLIRYRENGNNYTEFIINPSNTELIDEINRKYRTINSFTLNEGDTNDKYPEIAETGIHKIFGCFAYPYFPVSSKLYIYNCNASYIDKVIESQTSTERLFGISLASVEINSEWTNQSQTTAETLDIVTSVRPITVSVNSIINIPHGSTTSIYVIGDNQRYPLWRSSHSLTYRVIN